jgi:hypothetical protein
LVGTVDLQIMVQLYTGVILASGLFMLVVTVLTRGRLGHKPAEEPLYRTGAPDKTASA